ncbi:unnamed protein product [Closterium sp. NIES-54]
MPLTPPLTAADDSMCHGSSDTSSAGGLEAEAGGRGGGGEEGAAEEWEERGEEKSPVAAAAATIPVAAAAGTATVTAVVSAAAIADNGGIYHLPSGNHHEPSSALQCPDWTSPHSAVTDWSTTADVAWVRHADSASRAGAHVCGAVLGAANRAKMESTVNRCTDGCGAFKRSKRGGKISAGRAMAPQLKPRFRP